jgi:hypothetical protein
MLKGEYNLTKFNTIIQGSRVKYPYYEGKHLIVPIELFVFADESGIQSSAKYCLVLGFIGSPRHWGKFEIEWKKVLDNYKVTEFHAKEFFGKNPKRMRIGQYQNWTSIQADSFLEGLLSVVRSRRLYPVGGAVDVTAFNSFTHDERRFFTGGLIDKTRIKWRTSGAPSKPYYFAMNLLIVDALSNADPDANLHFIFDEQNVLQSRAIQTFRENFKAGPLSKGLDIMQVKSVTFANSIDEPGLQLADMYAYAWHRYLARKELVSEGIHRILETITPKRAKRGPGIVIFDRAPFQKLLNKLPTDVQDRLKAGKL